MLAHGILHVVYSIPHDANVAAASAKMGLSRPQTILSLSISLSLSPSLSLSLSLSLTPYQVKQHYEMLTFPYIHDMVHYKNVNHIIPLC
jgi:hypothetical protein